MEKEKDNNLVSNLGNMIQGMVMMHEMFPVMYLQSKKENWYFKNEVVTKMNTEMVMMGGKK